MKPGTRAGVRFLRRLASTIVIVAALVPVLASPAQAASEPCWQQVIHEWAAGRLGDHPTSCYRHAIARAPADLRLYSTFDDDVHRAMQSHVLDRFGARVRHLSGVSPAPPASRAEGWRPGDATLAACAVVLVAATWTAIGLLVRRRRRAATPR